MWGIAWPNTPQGSISVQICPGSLNSVGMWLMHAIAMQHHNFIAAWMMRFLSFLSGNATRFCSSDSKWDEVNVLNCTSREFVQLEEMLVSFVAEWL
jgi:hypothetical protein